MIPVTEWSQAAASDLFDRGNCAFLFGLFALYLLQFLSGRLGVLILSYQGEVGVVPI